MGIDPDLLVATEVDGAALGEVIAATQAPPDGDSRALTRALLDAPLRRAADASAARVRGAARARRFASALCRMLIGGELADALAVDKTSWDVLPPFVRRFVAGAERVRRCVPFAVGHAFRAGQHYWDRVASIGLADATSAFVLPEGLPSAA
jgi:hypothetical protein